MTFRDLEDSRRHAVTASELLAGIDATRAHLDGLTPDEHLQLIATGNVRNVNENLRWTVQLAVAHALTAIALRDGEPPAA